MGALMARVDGQWQPVGVVGATGPIGISGETGATGPTGSQGVPGTIQGTFGVSKTPADLPPTGLVPADWDAIGSPAADHQFVGGEFLMYMPADELDPERGDLYDYSNGAWWNLGKLLGPPGVAGEQGPTGPTGPPEDEVWVGAAPTGASGPLDPNVEIWFDPTSDRYFGGSEFPLGGSTGNALIKASPTDGDLEWSGGAGDSIRVGDNAGFLTAGGGGIFKKSGAGIVLRRHNNNAAIPIENNDGTAGTNIVTANGAVQMTGPLTWPNTADVTKLRLYGSEGAAFGLGITAGSMDLFASSTIRFKHHSITGTQWAYIDAGGIGPHGQSNVSWQNGFTGTADLRYNRTTTTLRIHHVSKNSSETGSGAVQWKMFDYPSGVVAPWANLVEFVPLYTGDDYNFTGKHVMIQARTDGVWMMLYGGAAAEDYASGDRMACSITWAR